MSKLISVHHHQLIPGSPLVFGPGSWWVIHLKSYHCDSKDKINDFLEFIHTIVSNIPCPMCRRNAIDYITRNDGSEYKDKVYKGKNVGMFLWMVNFHNDVNKRNNKDILKVSDVYKAYSNPNIKSKYIPDNPSVIGPGIWWVLHLLSYKAKSNLNKFIKFIKILINNLPCITCRDNAIQYIYDNKPGKYVNQEYDNRNVGMYVWMSDFHNNVNKKNKLKTVDWKEGYTVYKHAYKVHDFDPWNDVDEESIYTSSKCQNPNCPHHRKT